MKASDRMTRRAILFHRLTVIDDELIMLVGKEPSTRASAIARGLLNNRADVSDELVTVGFSPWPVPIDADESKVSHG